jgi:predicted RND superfamily exporter protein
MTVPVLISGLTTMVGYAALLITDVPAVYEIGAFSVLGIASVTLVALTLIPAALALLPLRPPGGAARWRAAEAVARPLDAALALLARLASRHSGGVIALWLALGAAALLVIPRIQIDTDYLSFFDRDDEVRQQFDAINRLLAGVVPLYVVLDGPGPGGFRDPELLRRIESLQARIDAGPGVSRTFSAIDTLKLLNRAVEGGDPAAARLPDSREAVTELFFMFPKSELTRVVTVDQSEANVVVRTGEVGSASIRALTARIDALLGDDALPPGVRARVTGNALLLDRAADGVARSQPRTMVLASLAIFALLAGTLRSLRLGALAMIPNAIPVLVFFGVLGVGLAPLSLPTSLIGSVALGIAIDGTAHYTIRFRAERLLGASRDEAVMRTTLAVGRAISIASAMLILGFLAVCFSEFATLRQFGWLSAFTMAVCGLADLTLTPALLVRARL